ncbi:uncharacterized protein DEA37_0009095 [Paragonimus westermani]|uniref:Uncharacterized protein n=1 Tax=Paragonimus westermani TaxID=34504 RepID=A0A5J4NQH8_9TREM|nr:uncharacterized protein DEA37_0009095 [Paragonimus westermani]
MHPSKVYDEEIVRQTMKNKLEQLIRSTQTMLKGPMREAFTKTERELISSEQAALNNNKEDRADYQQKLETLSDILERVSQRFEDRRLAEAALQQTITGFSLAIPRLLVRFRCAMARPAARAVRHPPSVGLDRIPTSCRDVPLNVGKNHASDLAVCRISPALPRPLVRSSRAMTHPVAHVVLDPIAAGFRTYLPHVENCQTESQQEHLTQAQREQLELLHCRYLEEFKEILTHVSDSDSAEHIQQVTEHMWLLQKNLERQLNNITPAPEPVLQLSKETAEENTRLFHKKRLRRLTSDLKHRLAGPLNDFATDNEKKAIDWLGSVLERTDSDSAYYERQYQDLEATTKTIENRFISRSKANESFQNALNNCYVAVAKMHIHGPGYQPLSPTKTRQLQSLYYNYKTQFQHLSNQSFGVTQSDEIRNRTQEIEELRKNLDKDWKKMCTEPANSNTPSLSYATKTPSEADMSHLRQLVGEIQAQLQGPYNAFITELEQNGLMWVTFHHKRDDLSQAECELQRDAMSDIIRLVKKRFAARVQAKEALRIALLEKRKMLEHATSRISEPVSISEAARDQLQATISKYQSALDCVQMTSQPPSLLSVIEDQTNYITDIVEKFHHEWNSCFERSLKPSQEESLSSTALEISRLEAKSKLAEVTSNLQRKLSDQPFAWYATTREKAGLEWVQSTLSTKEAERSYYERQTQVLLVIEDLIRQRMDERAEAIQALTNSFQSDSEAIQQNASIAETADDIELITQSLKQLHQAAAGTRLIMLQFCNAFIPWNDLNQRRFVLQDNPSQTAHMVNGSCVTDLKSSTEKKNLADLINRLEQKVGDTAAPFVTPLEKMGLRGIQAALNHDELLDTERMHRQLDALHELASTIICREIARNNAKEEFQKALVPKGRVHKTTVRALSLYGSETWPLKTEDVNRLKVFDHRRLRSVARNEWHQRELWIKWNEATEEVNPSVINGTTVAQIGHRRHLVNAAYCHTKALQLLEISEDYEH